MKQAWEAIKAFFAIRKLIKNFDKMTLENIRKIWVLIGSILGTLSISLPDIINDFFSTEGTNLVFAAASALIALWQFASARIGSKAATNAIESDDQDFQEMVAIDFKGKAAYFLPWTSGPKITGKK